MLRAVSKKKRQQRLPNKGVNSRDQERKPWEGGWENIPGAVKERALVIKKTITRAKNWGGGGN